MFECTFTVLADAIHSSNIVVSFLANKNIIVSQNIDKYVCVHVFCPMQTDRSVKFTGVFVPLADLHCSFSKSGTKLARSACAKEESIFFSRTLQKNVL